MRKEIRIALAWFFAVSSLLAFVGSAHAAVGCSGGTASLVVQNDENGFVPPGQQLSLSITVSSPSNGIFIFLDSADNLYGQLPAGPNTLGIAQPASIPVYASGAHVIWIASLDSGFYPHTECGISFNVGSGPNVRQFPNETPVYRFFNGRHHFFTLSYSEGIGAGFSFERVGFYVWNRQLDPAMVQLYRCYVSKTDDHFVSAQPTCEGYTSEGAFGWVFPASWNGRVTVPGNYGNGQLSRFWNGRSDHLVTLDINEGSRARWVYEGFIAYVPIPTSSWPDCCIY